MIYFDHAATSFPKPMEVVNAVNHAMETCSSIGRSGHRLAMSAAEIAFETRKAAGAMFDTPPDHVVFTNNATHGLNIAIRSVVSPGDKVLISGFEHNAVVRPLYHLGTEIMVAGNRLFDPDHTLYEFEKNIKSGIHAVVCTHVSNVFGYILPVEEIASLCRQCSIPFILDASQSAGVLPVSLLKLQASFIAMPGHKALFGPQGTGLLLCGQMPKPLLYGGTGSNSRDNDMPQFLPDLAEAGTHNVPGIAGLLSGIRYVQNAGQSKILSKEQDLVEKAVNILNCYFDKFDIYSNISCQSGVLSWNIKGVDCETVAAALAQQGVAVRAGLHCAPLAHKSAGTIGSGTVRMSFSCMNTEEELDAFSDTISGLVERGFSF